MEILPSSDCDGFGLNCGMGCCVQEMADDCYSGGRVECGEGEIFVCQYDGNKSYMTVCMIEENVSSHLANNIEDYYGRCVKDQFVEDSLLLGLSSDQGSDESGLYKVDYELSYNQNGIVDLSSSAKMIDGVYARLGLLKLSFPSLCRLMI